RGSRSSPTDVATELRFGVWGVCATSAFNQVCVQQFEELHQAVLTGRRSQLCLATP
ncbi:unnamed protein product, partial [Mycena citricolor]